MSSRENNSNAIVSRNILSWKKEQWVKWEDHLLEEAPLEIVLCSESGDYKDFPLSLTMRTPGADELLVTGFLFTEGIIHRATDIAKIELQPAMLNDDSRLSRARVYLSDWAGFKANRADRNFFAASSCGICGKPGMDQVCQDFHFLLIPGKPKISSSAIPALARELQITDSLFTITGGAHTAGLLDADFRLLDYQEDVGRHNALDKLIGKALLENSLPLQNHILLLSGRIGFELVQKALRAGIPIIFAFGAASDGAVRLAEAHGMTLAGFLKSERLNVYCGTDRIGSL